MKRALSAFMFVLLLASTLAFSFNLQSVKASGTIYIRADGSIDPPTAPISTVDNVTYTLTGNITSDADGIVVERSDVVVDGAGYTLQGTGAYPSKGIYLYGISNVTIKNASIKSFYRGIWLESSSNNSVSGNNITANNLDGIYLDSSSNSTVSGNNITNNGVIGVYLVYSSNYNSVSGNNITNNGYGIWLDSSSNYNRFYHNNFVNNNIQVYSSDSANVWDDGYPSGGNFWSDYDGLDAYHGSGQDESGGDGIGDTPYVIDGGNVDQYPLMEPWPAPFLLTVISPQNKTYYSSSIPVSLILTKPASWIGYSLDNQQNVTITGNTIINVEDGSHQIIIHANDTSGNMISSQIICFTVAPSQYDPWKSSFIGLDSYPIVDFAVYNGSLYAAADNRLYVYDQSSWNIVGAPAFATSLEPYGGKLVVGGQGGLYCYDGTSFSLIFPVPTYVKVLGAYDNRLYAGTMLDNQPKLHYCNGSADNPSDWHIDTSFSAILNFSGAFGSIDSFAVYDDAMYVGSGGNLYSFNGTDWSIAASYDDVYAFLDMKVYDGKLYLATRDQGWRKPYYQGGTGFSGRVIEFDGETWTTVLDHDYGVYSLEEYDGKLYAGTANKILMYNGTSWETSFNATEGAYYAISMIAYDGKIYAGMGNGYIFADPAPPKAEQEPITVPEFSSTAILVALMTLTILAAVLTKKNRARRPS